MFYELSGKPHWVDDCPLQDGTAEEVTVYRQREMRRRIEAQQPETHTYASTEMFALEFEEENEITKAAEEKDITFPLTTTNNDVKYAPTEQGEAFIAFVRLILKQTGLIRLLWGKVFESKAKIILLLDWQTTNAPQVMHNTPSFQQALQRLDEKLKRHIRSQIFDFWDENMRDQCLAPHPLCPHWTAFYMWRFPAKIRDKEIVPITTQTSGESAMISRSWEMHWMHFCLKMCQRQGGGMSWMGSWLKAAESGSDDDGEDTYRGVIALRGRKMLQDGLSRSEKLPYEEGGIKDLRGLASEGLDVFHVRFLHPTQHSLGSHDPPVSYDMRGMFAR